MVDWMSAQHAANSFVDAGMHVVGKDEWADYVKFRAELHRMKDMSEFIMALSKSDVNIPIKLAVPYARAMSACEGVDSK